MRRTLSPLRGLPVPRSPPDRIDLDAEFYDDLARREGGRALALVLDLVGRHSLWVDPAVARAVPVVFPKTARAVKGRGRQGQVVDGVRLWANQPAQDAFYGALGSTARHFKGAALCHIYPRSPQDPLHFTRLSDLVAVPASLGAFTEGPPGLAVLKRRAYELYGYRGPQSKIPPTPPICPAAWAPPVLLPAALRTQTVARLRHWRATRPMYSTPRRGQGPRRLAPLRKLESTRGLEADFWREVTATPASLAALVSLFVRYARFAPPSIAAEVPNPFPLTRRARRWQGERPGTIVGGIGLEFGQAPGMALLVTVGLPASRTVGEVVDHPWQGAAFLPAHNCRLAGLVLLPRSLSTLADSAPIRALLQRRLFERTGYAGPAGREPRRPAFYPDAWPETVHLSPAREAHAIKILRRNLKERPQYYRPQADGR